MQLGILISEGGIMMTSQERDKFVKNQNRGKTDFPNNSQRANNVDPKTNNRKNSNTSPGATGRGI